MKHSSKTTKKPMDTQSSIFGIAEGFFEWWINELRAMVPAALLARSAQRSNCAIDIVLSEDGTIAVHSAKQTGIFLRGQEDALKAHLSALAEQRVATIRLDVPKASCLIRKSTLPKRALRDTRKILEMEISENTPLDPGEIYSDWYVETEDPIAGQLHIRQIILSRHRIATLRQILEDEHLHLSRLTVGHGEGRPVPVDLLARDDPSFRAFLTALSWKGRLAWGLALILLCALPFLLVARSEQQMAALQQRRAEAMRQLQSVPTADPLALLLAIQPSPAFVLDEVSAHLPEDATLASLELVNGNLTVALATPTQTRLSAALAGSKLLVNGRDLDERRASFQLAVPGGSH